MEILFISNRPLGLALFNFDPFLFLNLKIFVFIAEKLLEKLTLVPDTREILESARPSTSWLGNLCLFPNLVAELGSTKAIEVFLA